ncbi:hypothetical protein VP01_61g11 [Puccinia sorghi]|uniref:Uncharacterized protein n=1 Tax=Puccinia sorghi TaxID=27349 RepID=A0A0L6UGR6_9BASI|nr:hypothetical protein VP01_61g11 [Puccinia sorghi]
MSSFWGKKTKLKDIFNHSTHISLKSSQSKYFVTHAKSLIGKEFEIFLQAAPFILFPFLDQDQCDMWHSLSILSSYKFQTHIINMANFQAHLKTHISNFLHHTIKSTAQWINKPKFHMLVHLPDSILCFGPAPLFSTEKFESYNGILRNASTHSNRLAPGRDIAIEFSNYHSFSFKGILKHP